MKVLVAGFSPQSTAAVEIIVGSLWSHASFVKLARGATFAPPEQPPEALQCDICVVDLLGLGMATWSPEHEVELQAFLGDRRAVLFVPAGSDESWPSALAARGPARVVLQHPASTAALREALAALHGDHPSDGISASEHDSVSETGRAGSSSAATAAVTTIIRQAEVETSKLAKESEGEQEQPPAGRPVIHHRDEPVPEQAVEAAPAPDAVDVPQTPAEASTRPNLEMLGDPSVQDEKPRAPAPETEFVAEPLSGSSADALHTEESTLPLDISGYTRHRTTARVSDSTRVVELSDAVTVPVVVAPQSRPAASAASVPAAKAGQAIVPGREHRREELPVHAARVPSPALAALMSGVSTETATAAAERGRSAAVRNGGGRLIRRRSSRPHGRLATPSFLEVTGEAASFP